MIAGRRHIGIVACSAEGAALCYREIVHEASRRGGVHDHPEISMHGHSLGEYVRRLEAGDWLGIAELMLSSAGKLASIGAEVLVCPDNTIHLAWSHLEASRSRPWIHIADVVAKAAADRGYSRVGVMGTSWLVRSDVYPERLGRRAVECLRPAEAEVDEVGQIIMDELVHGDFRTSSLDRLRSVVDSLRADGAQAVVLGCTELPLVLNDESCSLTTLDSTRLLAKAAVDWCDRRPLH